MKQNIDTSTNDCFSLEVVDGILPAPAGVGPDHDGLEVGGGREELLPGGGRTHPARVHLPA